MLRQTLKKGILKSASSIDFLGDDDWAEMQRPEVAKSGLVIPELVISLAGSSNLSLATTNAKPIPSSRERFLSKALEPMLYEELRQIPVASDESEEQFERDIGGLDLIVDENNGF